MTTIPLTRKAAAERWFMDRVEAAREAVETEIRHTGETPTLRFARKLLSGEPSREDLEDAHLMLRCHRTLMRSRGDVSRITYALACLAAILGPEYEDKPEEA